MDGEDLYSLLGVSREATDAEIKKAFRQRVLELHPDRNPDNPDAELRFKQIVEAYQVLSDKVKRAEYNGVFKNLVEDALVASATAIRREKQARAAEAVEVETYASRRTDRRGRLVYRAFETNEVRQDDAIVGMMLGFLVALVCDRYFGLRPSETPWWFFYPAGIACIVCVPILFRLGRAVALLFDSGGDSIVAAVLTWTLPVLYAGAGLGAVAFYSGRLGLDLYRWSLLPAACSAGLSTFVAGGIGRAFASGAEDMPTPYIGMTVGGLVGGIAGTFLGLCLASPMALVGADLSFYQEVFVTAAGSGLGGMLAGAWVSRLADAE